MPMAICATNLQSISMSSHILRPSLTLKMSVPNLNFDMYVCTHTFAHGSQWKTLIHNVSLAVPQSPHITNKTQIIYSDKFLCQIKSQHAHDHIHIYRRTPFRALSAPVNITQMQPLCSILYSDRHSCIMHNLYSSWVSDARINVVKGPHTTPTTYYNWLGGIIFAGLFLRDFTSSDSSSDCLRYFLRISTLSSNS